MVSVFEISYNTIQPYTSPFQMKKTSFRLLAMAVLFTASGNMAAQDLRTAYFSDHYLYRHDLNPAIDNEDSYISIPVLGNVNVSMMGNFGYEELVRKNPLYPKESDKKMTSFINPYLSNQLKGFASGDNKVNADLKVSLFSMGFKKWGGYNTLELNSRTSVNVNAPYKLFQFAADMGNRNYDIGDISLSGQTYVELSLGHSRQVDRKLRVGAKLKLLVGGADVDFRMTDVKADLTPGNVWRISGDAQSHVSMKGFKYLSKTKEYNNKQGSYTHVNDVDVDGAGVGGFGAAIDAGAVYKVNDQLTVSAAVQDLGAIFWTDDFHATNDAKTFVFDGFHDVSADSSSPDKLDNKADSYTDQMLDFANLRDKGNDGSRVTGIGATLSAGCMYQIPTLKMLKVGLLGMAHINGPFSWTEARLSGNITPAKWFDGALSLAVNNYSANFGFLANFRAKKFGFHIGMDRMIGKVSHEMIPLSSNGSVSLGFNIIL